MYQNSLLSGTMGDLAQNRYSRLNLNYWTATNPTNDYYGVWQPEPYRSAIQYMNANFVRVSNITLGYNLPKTILDKMKFNQARFYVQANNPFVFVKDRTMWMDPEFNSNTVQDDVPCSTFIFGLKLTL
jgi:hypothetical protein